MPEFENDRNQLRLAPRTPDVGWAGYSLKGDGMIHEDAAQQRYRDSGFRNALCVLAVLRFTAFDPQQSCATR